MDPALQDVLDAFNTQRLRDWNLSTHPELGAQVLRGLVDAKGQSLAADAANTNAILRAMSESDALDQAGALAGLGAPDSPLAAAGNAHPRPAGGTGAGQEGPPLPGVTAPSTGPDGSKVNYFLGKNADGSPYPIELRSGGGASGIIPAGAAADPRLADRDFVENQLRQFWQAAGGNGQAPGQPGGGGTSPLNAATGGSSLQGPASPLGAATGPALPQGASGVPLPNAAPMRPMTGDGVGEFLKNYAPTPSQQMLATQQSLMNTATEGKLREIQEQAKAAGAIKQMELGSDRSRFLDAYLLQNPNATPSQVQGLLAEREGLREINAAERTGGATNPLQAGQLPAPVPAGAAQGPPLPSVQAQQPARPNAEGKFQAGYQERLGAATEEDFLAALEKSLAGGKISGDPKSGAVVSGDSLNPDALAAVLREKQFSPADLRTLAARLSRTTGAGGPQAIRDALQIALIRRMHEAAMQKAGSYALEPIWEEDPGLRAFVGPGREDTMRLPTNPLETPQSLGGFTLHGPGGDVTWGRPTLGTGGLTDFFPTWQQSTKDRYSREAQALAAFLEAMQGVGQ